jgi:hypothetical protein
MAILSGKRFKPVRIEERIGSQGGGWGKRREVDEKGAAMGNSRPTTHEGLMEGVA